MAKITLPAIFVLILLEPFTHLPCLASPTLVAYIEYLWNFLAIFSLSFHGASKKS